MLKSRNRIRIYRDATRRGEVQGPSARGRDRDRSEPDIPTARGVENPIQNVPIYSAAGSNKTY
jgi:hypothetical protein